MALQKRSPWFLPVLVLCVVWLGCPAVGRCQPTLEIVPEPGFVAGDGSWVLPYWLLGAEASVAEVGVELTAFHEGRPLRIDEQLGYDFGSGQSEATGLVILLDLPELDEEILDNWTSELTAWLTSSSSSGVNVSVARCGLQESAVPAPGQAQISAETLAQLLRSPEPSCLWDPVVSALNALTGSDLPERRVLLLISDGREEVASRHVMASCVEAALRARVAVYVLSLAEGAEAETARLHELARRTGGRLLAGEQAETGQLTDVLGWIGAAQGVRLEPVDTLLPAEISLRLNGQDEEEAPQAAGLGTVAPRLKPQGSGFSRWVLIGCALVAAGGAGYLIWRQRTVVAGELLIPTKNGVRRFPIPKEGVTIGRDTDNCLVLNAVKVSRHHAVIRVKGDQVIITDLRSSGGTMVNGEFVGSCPLASDDRITIGGSIEMTYKEHSHAK